MSNSFDSRGVLKKVITRTSQGDVLRLNKMRTNILRILAQENPPTTVRGIMKELNHKGTAYIQREINILRKFGLVVMEEGRRSTLRLTQLGVAQYANR